MKRERFRDWKVHMHKEDAWTMLLDKPLDRLPVRSCGSSIAHGECVYAGPITNGACLCHARATVWNGCIFRATHNASLLPAARELDEDAA
jgi:hypothetical protein